MEEATFLQKRSDSTILLGAQTGSFGNGGEDIWLVCLIPDQYARYDAPFNFRIPTLSDSSNYAYTPLDLPEGMISYQLKDDKVLKYILTDNQPNNPEEQKVWSIPCCALFARLLG